MIHHGAYYVGNALDRPLVHPQQYEGKLGYRSTGPFAETAWATAVNLPAPMPLTIQALLRRLLTLEVS